MKPQPEPLSEKRCQWTSPNEIFHCRLAVNHDGLHESEEEDGKVKWDYSSGKGPCGLCGCPAPGGAHSTDEQCRKALRAQLSEAQAELSKLEAENATLQKTVKERDVEIELLQNNLFSDRKAYLALRAENTALREVIQQALDHCDGWRKFQADGDEPDCTPFFPKCLEDDFRATIDQARAQSRIAADVAEGKGK